VKLTALMTDAGLAVVKPRLAVVKPRLPGPSFKEDSKLSCVRRCSCKVPFIAMRSSACKFESELS